MCCYSRGCRCEKCKRYNSEKNARYVSARRQRDPHWKAGAKGEGETRCPVRIAFSAGDLDVIRQVLQERSLVTESGCWKWPRVDKTGYPCLGNLRLHRAVLEIKHRAPLGVQQAHHVCAVRSCVNPDHLQPVTHRQNTAEMQQRATYLARIRELEQALASAAPDHPALRFVPVL